jgi:hypothetical protein
VISTFQSSIFYGIQAARFHLAAVSGRFSNILIALYTYYPAMRPVPRLLSVLLATRITAQACPYSQVIINQKISYEASLLPFPPREDPDIDISCGIIVPRVYGILFFPGHTLAQHQVHTGIPDDFYIDILIRLGPQTIYFANKINCTELVLIRSDPGVQAVWLERETGFADEPGEVREYDGKSWPNWVPYAAHRPCERDLFYANERPCLHTIEWPTCMKPVEVLSHLEDCRGFYRKVGRPIDDIWERMPLYGYIEDDNGEATPLKY